MNCACGNAARYINELGELTCGICPIKQGLDSIRFGDVPKLLAWARKAEQFAPTAIDYDDLRSVIGRKPLKGTHGFVVTPEQLFNDQTYETYVPTSKDGHIIGEPLAQLLKERGR